MRYFVIELWWKETDEEKFVIVEASYPANAIGAAKNKYPDASYALVVHSYEEIIKG